MNVVLAEMVSLLEELDFYM